ncbi:MAG: SPFH domain-containing protein [Theionarchaea archaeon]|nr:SPFH domain-containing protein [Theionarchaea archaeon]
MHVIDYRGEDLVNAYRGEVELGDQCVVRENQQAVFFRDGKAYDVLGPGRHTLTTLNIPLIYRVYKAFFDGRTPFTAEVVFVNTSKFTIKFGTKQKVMLKDMVPVGSFGTMFLQIEDPKLFVIEVVGNLSRFTEIEVKSFIESFIVEKFIDTLADYTSFEVYRQTEETSVKIRSQLRTNIGRFGLEMVDMRIEGVAIDDDYKNKLFYLQRGVTAQQLVGKEVAEKFAEAIRDTKSGGAALGAGFMAIPYALQGATQMMTGPGAALVQCSNCGMQVPRNAKFCPNCGTAMETVSAGMKCSKCGSDVPAGSKFCPNCGEKQ